MKNRQENSNGDFVTLKTNLNYREDKQKSCKCKR